MSTILILVMAMKASGHPIPIACPPASRRNFVPDVSSHVAHTIRVILFCLVSYRQAPRIIATPTVENMMDAPPTPDLTATLQNALLRAAYQIWNTSPEVLLSHWGLELVSPTLPPRGRQSISDASFRSIIGPLRVGASPPAAGEPGRVGGAGASGGPGAVGGGVGSQAETPGGGGTGSSSQWGRNGRLGSSGGKSKRPVGHMRRAATVVRGGAHLIVFWCVWSSPPPPTQTPVLSLPTFVSFITYRDDAP